MPLLVSKSTFYFPEKRKQVIFIEVYEIVFKYTFAAFASSDSDSLLWTLLSLYVYVYFYIYIYILCMCTFIFKSLILEFTLTIAVYFSENCISIYLKRNSNRNRLHQIILRSQHEVVLTRLDKSSVFSFYYLGITKIFENIIVFFNGYTFT